MRFFHLLMLTSLSQIACSQSKLELAVNSTISFSVDTVDVESLEKYIEEDENIILLDTRSRKEYETSHLKGARFIDYDNFDPKSLEEVDRNSTVVTYCSIGYRSERIGERLMELGFDNVLNLYGGIFEWKNSGNTVVDMKGNETDTVHTYNRIWSVFLKNGVKTYE